MSLTNGSPGPRQLIRLDETEEPFSLSLHHVRAAEPRSLQFSAEPMAGSRLFPIYTQCRFLLSNVDDPRRHRSFYLRNKFTLDSRVAESKEFAMLEVDTQSPNRTGHSQLISNNAVEISIWLRVLKSKSFEDAQDQISKALKEPCRKKGLAILSSRRYVNVYVQFFNSVPHLQHTILRLPPPFTSTKSNPCSALQRVLYRLHAAKENFVDSSEVIKTFPWETIPTVPGRFTRPGLPDFIRILDRSIFAQMKESAPTEANLFEKLFTIMTNTITTRSDSDYTSVTIDKLAVLPLKLRGKRHRRDENSVIKQSLLDCMRDYVSSSNTTAHDITDLLSPVTLSRTFLSFPPILRIAIDALQDDKRLPTLDFPHTLNLDSFIDPTSISTQSWVYNLHAVIVRYNTRMGDFYYTYIRSTTQSKADGESKTNLDIWYKYQDSQVTMHHIPWADCFVAEQSDLPPLPERDNEGRVSPCMLVYIHSAVEEQLCDSSKLVPEWDTKWLLANDIHMDGPLPINIQIVTDKTYAAYTAFGYASFSNQAVSIETPHIFIPSATDTLEDVVQRVLKIELKGAETKGRLWSVAARDHQEDDTERLGWPFTVHANQTIRSLCRSLSVNDRHMRFYLQITPSVTLDLTDHIFLFLKELDLDKRCFKTLGTCHIKRGSEIWRLFTIFNERMAVPFPYASSVSGVAHLFKEVSRGKCYRLEKLAYWTDLLDGDIVFCVTGGKQVGTDEVSQLLLEMKKGLDKV